MEFSLRIRNISPPKRFEEYRIKGVSSHRTEQLNTA